MAAPAVLPPITAESTAAEVVPIEAGIRLVLADDGVPRKLLIGSLASIVPVVGWWALCGWCARCFRAGLDEESELADWTDAGELVSEGMVGFTVLLVWFVLPVIFPIFLQVQLTPRYGYEPMFVPAFVLGMLLYVPILLVALKLLPAALCLVGARRSLWAAFDLRGLWSLARIALKPMIYAIVFYVLAQAVAQFALLLCLVGIVPALVWNHGVAAWMLGRVYAWYRLQPDAVG